MAIRVLNLKDTPESPSSPEKEQNPLRPSSPGEKLKQRRRERLEQQKAQITKKIEQLKKSSISEMIRYASLKLSQDPNSDPQELYNQIRSTLTDLGIANMVEKNKVQLVIGDTKGTGDRILNKFEVPIRRNDALGEDQIKRMSRNVALIDKIIWNAKYIIVYIWAKYTPPAEAAAPA